MHWQVVPLSIGLAWVYIDQGRVREAQTWAKRAAVVAHETYGKTNPRTAQAQSALAHVLLLQGRNRQAADKLQRCIDLKRRAGWEAGHASIAQDRFALAHCLAALGHYSQAHQEAEVAQQMCVQRAAGAPQREAAKLYGLAARARICVLQGDFETAEGMAKTLLNHPLCASSRDKCTAAPEGGELEELFSLSGADVHDERLLALSPEGSIHSTTVPKKRFMETQGLRIVAHMVMTRVCRVKALQQEAVWHATQALALVQHRYFASHPTAIAAALEWARAHSTLRATLTAHLEAEVVLLDAEKMLLAHYAVAPGAAPTSTIPPHPLLLSVSTTKAEILGAKNQHTVAVEEVRTATAGLQLLLLPHPSDAPHEPLANWVSRRSCCKAARSIACINALRVDLRVLLCSFVETTY